MVLHGKFTCVQIPLSNYCTQDFRYLHAMHRCEQTAQSLNILFRLAPPCMHVMAAQEYEVSFLSVSLSLSLSLMYVHACTHTQVPLYFHGYNRLYCHLPVHRKHFWNVGEGC